MTRSMSEIDEDHRGQRKGPLRLVEEYRYRQELGRVWDLLECGHVVDVGHDWGTERPKRRRCPECRVEVNDEPDKQGDLFGGEP